MRPFVCTLVTCCLFLASQQAVGAADAVAAATGTIVVTVRDSTGAPVPDADIVYANGSFITHYWADAQGSYTFQGGIPRVCSSTSPSVQPLEQGCIGPLSVPPGETLAFNLTLSPVAPSRQWSLPATTHDNQSTGWISGVVMLAGSHAPVPGVVIRLASTPLHTSTDAAGRYQFPGLSLTDGANGGAIYTVSLTPPPGDTVVGAASQQVTVQADHGAEADFTLQAATCQFVLGFAALHAARPAVVGACVDNEQHAPNGDAVQHTTEGLLVWRKADNFTAFTDGYHTWVAGPNGLQERLNTHRFPWEANPNHLPLAG